MAGNTEVRGTIYAGTLSPEDAREIAADIYTIEKATGLPIDQWVHQCHGVSLAIVKAGIFGPARVVRGRAAGVISQHSWIVLDPGWAPETRPWAYDPQAVLIDPTLWSYRDDVKGIYVSRTGDSKYGHRAHGAGHIFEYEMPHAHGGKIIELTPGKPLGALATAFLRTLGPLDFQGWGQLVHGPMEGWPSAEIITAVNQTKALAALTPIDITGHVTDLNPKGLYF